MTGDDESFLAPPAEGSPPWRCFDAIWYACAYPGATGTGSDAASLLRHYRETGARNGFSPNMYFDEAWYRLRYPDVTSAITAGTVRSGYDHYCRNGHRDRSPHWLYDKEEYARRRGTLEDLAEEMVGCVNGYDHFLRVGAFTGCTSHPLFDPAAYRNSLAHEPGAAAAIESLGAFHHFLARIWYERREARTSPFFDSDWFLSTYPEMAERVASGQAQCALHAYLTALPAARYNPLPVFDESFYLQANPDVAQAVQAGAFSCGYLHFLKFGSRDLRDPGPGLSLRNYIETCSAARMAIARGNQVDAFHHLMSEAAEEAASLLAQSAASPRIPVVTGGHIDNHGYTEVAEGWTFVGWVPYIEGLQPGILPATARFVDGELMGHATVVVFPRSDVAEIGSGVVVFIPGQRDGLNRLAELELSVGARTLRVPADAMAPAQTDRQIVATAGACFVAAEATPALAALKTRLARQPYTGGETISGLRDRVFIEFDETILCPPIDEAILAPGLSGLILCGWLLAGPGVVERIRVHCGDRRVAVNLADMVRIERPDVLEGVGHKNGLTDLRSGFMAYVPDILRGDEIPYLEVTTARGEVGYRPLPAPRLRGMEAIRFLLDRVELRYGEVAPAFDNVFGPSVARLNADRLRLPPASQTIDFGAPRTNPVLSVIVTLYGRLDFLEYQLAFFSRHMPKLPFELIYVLDDPPRRRQLESLAASAHARFGIPFRLVLLARNLGFAPANNVGLALATGSHVCFLNSDVFPGSNDWMEKLVDRLRTTATLGAIGPMLLFEDGCVQHQGMDFERLPAFAGWHFPIHPGKGWRPRHDDGVWVCPAITGACIVMTRELALELGGFDPSFAIGDFEDSDLCLKLRARGLDVAVDAGVHLYHLERQSQAGSQHRWRMNLTLFNAWVHERRWGVQLAKEPSADAEFRVVAA